jgi:glycosyltransferase involved in cell wall biosynthesis
MNSEDVAAMAKGEGGEPELSFIMPCYNEEEVIPFTIPRFVRAFEQAGYRLELVTCDNGSSDRTGEILTDFARRGLPVVPHRVEANVGYGNGVLQSLPFCRGKWIGIIPADGQVDAEDVVRLYEAVMHTDGQVIAKVHRRFRMDGVARSIVSYFYNLFVLLLWPGLGTFDVNGSPKILHRDVLAAMNLESQDWLLDPEILIKGHYMGIRLVEMNVFARMREFGSSHVRPGTAWEFVHRLVGFRLGREFAAWRRGRRNAGAASADTPADSA